LGAGKGGGSPKLAQGGGLDMNKDQVVEALGYAEELIWQREGIAP